jgi:hypothetical protein
VEIGRNDWAAPEPVTGTFSRIASLPLPLSLPPRRGVGRQPGGDRGLHESAPERPARFAKQRRPAAMSRSGPAAPASSRGLRTAGSRASRSCPAG